MKILRCITALLFFTNAYAQTNGINFNAVDKTIKKSDFVIEGTFIRHLPETDDTTKSNERQFYEVQVARIFLVNRKEFAPSIFPTTDKVMLVEHGSIKFNWQQRDSTSQQNSKTFIFFIKQKNNPDSIADFEITDLAHASVYEIGDNMWRYIASSYFIQYETNNYIPLILPDTFAIKKNDAIKIAQKKKLYYKDANGWTVDTRPEFQNKQWVIRCTKRKGKMRYINAVYIEATTGKVLNKTRIHYEVKRHTGPKF